VSAVRKRTFDLTEIKMNKLFSKFKIGTLLTVLLSLVLAVSFWLFVSYADSLSSQELLRLALLKWSY
jgi:hypothetical protein